MEAPTANQPAQAPQATKPGATEAREGPIIRTSSANPRQRPRAGSKNVGGADQAGCWSQSVTRGSSALDLEPAVFTWDDPREIARSLRRSADASTRRKASPYRSAVSMLTLYINRAGRSLSDRRRPVLEQAKAELRKLFDRE